MKNSKVHTIKSTPMPYIWSTYHRLIHWLVALSLAGGASFTHHGDAGHAELGWLTLGLVIGAQLWLRQPVPSNPTLWFVALIVSIINLSGLIMPAHSFHLSVTLIGVVLSAFYIATVLFESLNYLSSKFSSNLGANKN